MRITSWRIINKKYATSAFSGEGAFKFGGRWNTTGNAVVYTSESLSLAALEVLAGLNGVGTRLLDNYVRISAEFDSSLVSHLSRLPSGWNSFPESIAAMELGDTWIKESRSPVLKVPSVIIPQESNYLINPLHPGFKAIAIGKTHAFSFDKRFL